MNDLKHTLLLPDVSEPSKKHQPWYKERLKKRIDYMQSKNRFNKKNGILDARQWMFIKDDLDDFRDGLPPPHDDILIKPSKGPNPAIKNDTWIFKKSALPPVKRYSVNQLCYSHALPMAKAKRDRIDELINGLAAHPLALYAHLEESLPADLFDEIVDLLDPEMNQNLNGTTEQDTNTQQEANTETQSAYTSLKDALTRTNTQYADTERVTSTIVTQPETERKSVRNTYKWLLKKEEARERARGLDSDELKAHAIDNHMKQVTEDFCIWTQNLGGENNIDPVTLTSLFASGHETKPALSVPIHVVELSNIPPELRNSSLATSAQTKVQHNYIPSIEPLKSHRTKNRFGAWYLPKELWKVMPSNEKLVDPKLLVDKSKEEAKRRAEEMNAKLAPLHGTKSFKDFIKSKQTTRVPEILEQIDEWTREQEKRRIELEIAKQLEEKLKVEASEK